MEAQRVECPYTNCQHEQVEIRKRTRSNGVTVPVEQCLRCGSERRAVPKRNVLLSTLKEFDEALPKRWSESLHGWYEARREEYQRQEEDKNSEWWQWYNRYLLSPQWAELRRQVLERCKGICEGCRKRPAVQAHHLTYERAGKEMLFDLVGVCMECHKQIHPKMGE